MAIFLTDETRVVVQGITGKEGTLHTKRMRRAGTNIVAGVTPGKGGEWFDGIPVFETMQTAVDATGANTSVIFVPPAYSADAMYEAIDAGIDLIVCITEGIPLIDTVRVREYIRQTPSRLIGPNSPGISVPDLATVGIIPHAITIPGNIGIVSRSGTLTYEITHLLTRHGLGQSTVIGIGGDLVVGTNFNGVLEQFEDDPQTRQVILVGEIGGTAEHDAANYIQAHMTKPVFAYIVGRSIQTDATFGHAGATISEQGTNAQSKIEALSQAGARIINRLDEIPQALRG